MDDERLTKQLAEEGMTTPAWRDRCDRCSHERWEHGVRGRLRSVCSAFQNPETEQDDRSAR